MDHLWSKFTQFLRCPIFAEGINISKTYLTEELSRFPVEEINKSIKKDMNITEEFIDDLLLTQKDDQYAFSILALLFPNLNYKDGTFHKDHMHPDTMYKKISAVDEENHGWEVYNSICNLQLLDGNENQSKNGSSLISWFNEQCIKLDRATVLKKYLIPDVDLDISNFGSFIEARKKIIKTTLNQELS